MVLKIRLVEAAKAGAEPDTFEAAAIDNDGRALTVKWFDDYSKPRVYLTGEDIAIDVELEIITSAECDIDLVTKAAAMIRHGDVSHYIQSGATQF